MVSLKVGRPCIHCKGAHSEENCPLYRKALSLYKIGRSLTSDSFSGSSPSPFVGRYGYPRVNIGLLAPPELGEHIAGYDDPRGWAERKASIPDVVGMRSSMINSRTSADIRSSSNVLELAQEVALASKPVDLDISLKARPAIDLRLDGTMAPMGPAAELRKVTLSSNPQIDTRVDRVFSDTDLKAAEAMVSLYDHGIDENRLSRMLSTATMGIGANRKLVPTRWSITATDDTIGKRLITRVRDFSLRHDYAAYFGSHMGNYYLVLMFPDVWGYELFESHVPSKAPDGSWSFSTDDEGYDGRKNYAENTAGGYYTARLAVCEQLCRLNRQASALVLRFVTSEYTVPLGVWVTREACRNSMSSKPQFFGSKQEMLQHARSLVSKSFGLDLDFLLRRSRLLKSQQQASLLSFDIH